MSNKMSWPFTTGNLSLFSLTLLKTRNLNSISSFRAHRPEEAIYLIPSRDRVTCIFSTIFKEETDRILGRVFLQEFVDARRRPSCQTAPQVLYSNREPPLEIRHLKGLDMTEKAGYVTFGTLLFLSLFSLLSFF